MKLITEQFKTIINTGTSFFARAQMYMLPREVVSRENRLPINSVSRVCFPVANDSSTLATIMNSVKT